MFSTPFNSLIQLLNAFPDDDACRAYLEERRWKGTPRCPHCKHSENAYSIDGGKRYKCPNCRKKYSVLVGTMFENSKVGLRKWFVAIYLITSHKKGISSCQLAKDVGVTQKTAWFMLHRIREMLQDKSPHQLQGEVEVDETLVGGSEKNKHRDKRTKNKSKIVGDKAPVLGIVERGTGDKPSRVRFFVLDDTTRKSIHPHIMHSVKRGSRLHSDENLVYRRLGRFYDRGIVNHKRGQYVDYTPDGIITTNNIEGLFSHLKRGIIGVYHQVSRKHLQRYANATAFRLNTRKMNEGQRFDLTVRKCEGRLTYRALTKG